MENEKKSGTGRRAVKWLLRLLVFFLIVFIVAAVLLQVPFFQNAVVDSLTKKLTKDLDTQVDIGSIRLDVRNDLALDDVLILDLRGDTLLYAKRVFVDLKDPLKGLTQKELNIDEIKISGSQVAISVGPYGDKNFEFLGDYFSKSDQSAFEVTDTLTAPIATMEEGGWQINFVPTKVYLEDISLYALDSVRGKETEFSTASAEFILRKTNRADPLVVDDLHVMRPYFSETILFDPSQLKLEARDSNPDLPVASTGASRSQLETNDSIIITSATIVDGRVDLRNTPNVKQIDLAHVIDIADLNLLEVNTELINFVYLNQTIATEIEELSFSTPEGFVVDKVEAKSFTLDNQKLQLSDFVITTPHSRLRNKIIFNYQDIGDFKDFENKVVINGFFNNSTIAVRDLLYFSTDLNENEFFILNGGKDFQMDGRITGTVNNLRTKDLNLTLEDLATIDGDVAIRNVTSPGEELMNLRLKKATAHITTLRQLIPNFNLPANYDKLGNLVFSGNFDGFFEDFVAFGNLETDLGQLKTDLHMAFTNEDLQDANYTGNIELINFDLGRWSDSDEYGNATFFAEISEGRGLDLDRAAGKLSANLKSFIYRDYEYQNVTLDGDLNARYFSGNLKLDEKNASLDFDGSIDFTGEAPKFDFVADVEKLDLHKLNLSEKTTNFSGQLDFDFVMNDLYNLDGHIVGYDLALSYDSSDYALEYIEAYSSVADPNDKDLSIDSDILEFDMRGKYELSNINDVFKNLVHSKHPLLAQRLGIEYSDFNVPSNDLQFDLHVKNSQGLEKLFHPDLDTLREIKMDGFFANQSDKNFRYEVNLDLPDATFASNQVKGLVGLFDGENEESTWTVEGAEMRLGKKYVQPFSVQSTFDRDSLFFSIESEDIVGAVQNIDISGSFFLEDDYFVIDFEHGTFEFLDEPWSLNEKNNLFVGNRYIRAENLVFLAPDNSFLRVNSSDGSGLNVEAEKIDVSFLDELIDFNDFTFRGLANLNLEFKDLFNDGAVNLDLRIDSVAINDEELGVLSTEMHMDQFGSVARVNMGLVGDSVLVMAEGDFFAPILRADRNKPVDFDIDLTVGSLPLLVSEFFIGNSISNTSGFLSGDARFYSENQKTAILGDAYLNGSTTIDYLGTTYSMDSQKVHLTSTLFDFTGSAMLDQQGNKAVFLGGLPHNYFKKFGLDVSIVSPNFTFLNTAKGDNDLYYGLGVGTGDVKFAGNFKQTDITTTATTGPGSQIFIPIGSTYANTSGDFFKFTIGQDTFVEVDKFAEVTGIDFDMQLTITPAAEIQIIFDELAGEIIKGSGSGDLSIEVDRNGDFSMIGDYTIANGEYLFTYGGIVNKPFTVQRGGEIIWNGDPYNADLNIRAVYDGLRTSPKNLILEYLNTSASERAQLADISTDVDLILELQGILSAPEINFEILFPEIDPGLKNLVESKVRLLRDDPSELNRQVVGLLLLNTFLPPSTEFDLTSTTVNTLSELITSQLSNYVAAYLTQGVEEIDYISGIDLFFDYNFYRSLDFQQGTNAAKSGSEFAIAPNIRLFEERLAFSPGVSVLDGTILQGSSFIGTDVQLDYFVTDDRRLKLSLFHRVFPSLDGKRKKLGLGLRFIKEYDSYGDIFRKKKKDGITKRRKRASDKPDEQTVGKSN